MQDTGTVRRTCGLRLQSRLRLAVTVYTAAVYHPRQADGSHTGGIFKMEPLRKKYFKRANKKKTMGGTKMGRMRMLLWAALLAIVITGCTSTRYIGVPEDHHDTVYKARKDSIRYQTVTNIIDSIHIRDSTVVHTDATGKVTEIGRAHV